MPFLPFSPHSVVCKSGNNDVFDRYHGKYATYLISFVHSGIGLATHSTLTTRASHCHGVWWMTASSTTHYTTGALGLTILVT